MTKGALDGVLVIDKPRGPTSFDVVQRVRRALAAAKAGHTGTLDPMATGVLPVCVGDATRIAQFLTDGDKAYEAQLLLGAETDTLDAEGQVTATAPVPPLDRAMLEVAFEKFRGTFLQRPPMFSAVRVEGKRLHELARKGEEVEREAREVTVRSLVLLDFSQDTVRFSVEASKGFFVRVLAQELGKALGTLGHLTALRRTKSAGFTLAQAVPLAEVEAKGAAIGAALVSEAKALEALPALTVSAGEAQKVRHGGLVEVAPRPGLWRIVGPEGELLAVAEVERGRLRYRRVLAAGP